MSETSTKNEDTKKFSFNWFIIFIVTQIVFTAVIFFFVKQFCNDTLSLNEKNLQMNKMLIEQIEIEPIKDKTGKISFNMNIDEMKKTVNIGYTENHSKFMQAYYETQSNWLNFWMTLLAIILAAFGLIIPLSFMKLYETKAKELEVKHNKMLDEFKNKIKESEDRLMDIKDTIQVIETTVNDKAKEAEESAKQAKESEEIAKAQTLFNEGLALSEKFHYIGSIAKYNDAIKIFEKYKNSYSTQEQLSLCYNNIGTIYFNLENNEKAKSYYIKAITLCRTVSFFYANLAEVLIELQDYKEAEKQLHLSKQYADDNSNKLTDFINSLEKRLEQEISRDKK